MLDVVDGVIKIILKGDFLVANLEFERVKILIIKRNKLIRFADKSFVGWIVVEEYESDEFVEDLEDEKKLRLVERRALVKIREKKRKNAFSRFNFIIIRFIFNEVLFIGLFIGSFFFFN